MDKTYISCLIFQN